MKSNEKPEHPEIVHVGPWRAERASGSLSRPGETRRLEPKVSALLFLLAATPGRVVSREDITSQLWPGVIVGEDALPRCVSKLRRALDDDAQQPRYVETLPRRGYRLKQVREAGAEVAPRARRHRHWTTTAALAALLAFGGLGAWLAAPTAEPGSAVTSPHINNRVLLEQAAAFYSRYTRQDNESSIELYERVLATEPENAQALAGLANALSQRALRWPNETGTKPPQHTTLARALKEHRLSLPNARINLEAAQAYAEQAIDVSPQDARAWKAFGLSISAQGDIDTAIDAYQRAIELDPGAWGAMINLSEMHDIKGNQQASLDLLERAYALRPRYADLGVVIGRVYEKRGEREAAMLRYRNVLSYEPFHRDATVALARNLADTGEAAAAARLCERLVERVGNHPPCEEFMR